MCNFGFQPEALNRAFLDIFEELLVLQNFFFVQNYPPAPQKIFFKIFFSKFLKNIFKKYFQYLSVVPFWNRETKCHHMASIKI